MRSGSVVYIASATLVTAVLAVTLVTMVTAEEQQRSKSRHPTIIAGDLEKANRLFACGKTLRADKILQEEIHDLRKILKVELENSTRDRYFRGYADGLTIATTTLMAHLPADSIKHFCSGFMKDAASMLSK